MIFLCPCNKMLKQTGTKNEKRTGILCGLCKYCYNEHISVYLLHLAIHLYRSLDILLVTPSIVLYFLRTYELFS